MFTQSWIKETWKKILVDKVNQDLWSINVDNKLIFFLLHQNYHQKKIQNLFIFDFLAQKRERNYYYFVREIAYMIVKKEKEEEQKVIS